MKEELLRVGIGLLCLAGASVVIAGIFGLFMLLPRYPISMGVVCLIGLAWIIGNHWRM